MSTDKFYFSTLPFSHFFSCRSSSLKLHVYLGHRLWVRYCTTLNTGSQSSDLLSLHSCKFPGSQIADPLSTNSDWSQSPNSPKLSWSRSPLHRRHVARHKLDSHATSSQIDTHFEVDGAYATHHSQTCVGDEAFDEHCQQLVRDAIALHGVSSMAWYKEPEAMAKTQAIQADSEVSGTADGGLTGKMYKTRRAQCSQWSTAEIRYKGEGKGRILQDRYKIVKDGI